MKPLLQTKITRERRVVGDYIPAKDQATVEGLQDFAARQRARMEAAQKDRDEAKRVVRPLERKTR